MEETTQNNILLAEFLGWKRETVVRGRNGRTYDFLCPEYIEVIGESDAEYCSDCGRDTYRKDYLFGEDLLFHSSWDWLMPVLQKCDAVAYELRVHDDWIERFQTSLSQYDILDVYDVCIEFVKWHNENKSK